jgi:hypothetical protein
VPELVRSGLGHEASAFAIVMIGYALGSISAGLYLARRRVARKAYGSLLAWSLYLPGYLLIGLAGSLPIAVGGGICAGLGQGSAIVLVNAAAQEQVSDRVLGRVMGLISLVHRGAHATGLLLVSPLFVFVAPRPVFVGAALAGPIVGMAGALAALLLTRRAGEARERGSGRNRRS